MPCLLPAVVAQARGCAEVSSGRSDAALAALRTQGASIEYRDESDGPGKLMISTDGRWQGGDTGLAALKEVAGLYKVRLGANVTDQGLAEVAQICGLSSLDVHSVAVTDAGVRHLAPLTGLRRLNLTYTKVSDEGLRTFEGWTRLQWLGLSYTRVTRSGIEGLKRVLKQTVIEGNPTH
ncbi:hypothetical protein KR767_19030 [Luteibacter anthropi]|uniref:hypothetical protein n=1 Tax=Luteibacter anthropi TaxID=564369 RepID=UPI0020327D73|nr:hypothetical protein [Luteibacter anthropi]URX62114.1 hypothetical protein KR767_19030 [Luteibacter anthropi]